MDFDRLTRPGRLAKASSRILVVDDIPANLVAFRAVLEPLGQEIVTADSGERAIAVATQSQFAVVLLDVMMPGMDGFETLTRLRRIPSLGDTAILLVTAFEPPLGTIERAYATGAADYVPKPVSPDVLRAKVQVFIALHERRAALAARDRQIAILAHDLRSPLSTITMSAGTINLDSPADRIYDRIQRIQRAAERMGAMVGDLLDFARMGAGGLAVEPLAADLSAICRDAVDEVGSDNPRHKIDLDLRGDLRGKWDPARMCQALVNLLGNAIKYGNGPIAVRARRIAEHAQVVVWNAGDPIPADRIAWVFEPFERGQDGGTGLGLGLYIVREIIRAHGGLVNVASSRQAGTRFTLTLPLAGLPKAGSAFERPTDVP